MGQRSVLDSQPVLRWDQPTSTRERWTAAAYIASISLIAILVVLAIVFDQFAATGVLLVAFLSIILVYLLAPLVDWLRRQDERIEALGRAPAA